MKKNNKKGFTLFELIIGITLLTSILAITFNFLFIQQQRNKLIELKSTSLLNLNILSIEIRDLVKNSYGIKSVGEEQICLFKDKIKKDYFCLIKNINSDLDISTINKIDNGNSVSLNSNSLYISKFEVSTSNFLNPDLHPLVSFSIYGRTRSPLKKPTEDNFYDLYNKSEVSLKKTISIWNYVPSSNKY